jgi:hypothetical protein
MLQIIWWSLESRENSDENIELGEMSTHDETKSAYVAEQWVPLIKTLFQKKQVSYSKIKGLV